MQILSGAVQRPVSACDDSARPVECDGAAGAGVAGSNRVRGNAVSFGVPVLKRIHQAAARPGAEAGARDREGAELAGRKLPPGVTVNPVMVGGGYARPLLGG